VPAGTGRSMPRYSDIHIFIDAKKCGVATRSAQRADSVADTRPDTGRERRPDTRGHFPDTVPAPFPQLPTVSFDTQGVYPRS